MSAHGRSIIPNFSPIIDQMIEIGGKFGKTFPVGIELIFLIYYSLFCRIKCLHFVMLIRV